ncbi:hypothetical protein CC2G_004106 [Coprinopsis cinerea AmutBmut pab1-1]|nr:hypothetical protein CC2G_004106 [Coprinopsis cinerea AmutBmut pab1-1]
MRISSLFLFSSFRTVPQRARHSANRSIYCEELSTREPSFLEDDFSLQAREVLMEAIEDLAARTDADILSEFTTRELIEELQTRGRVAGPVTGGGGGRPPRPGGGGSSSKKSKKRCRCAVKYFMRPRQIQRCRASGECKA